MNDCLFCKIVAEDIPSTKVFEDEKFLAFMDINPVAYGHLLIVPKDHYAWIQEVPDDILTESFLISKKLISAMVKGLSCDYVQLSIVGKDVPHFHIHLIPRYFDDKIVSWPTQPYSSPEEKESFASKIKSAI